MWSLAGMASGTRLKTQIAQMDDVSQLRQVAHLLDAENRRLHERLAKLTAELAALKGKSAPQQLSLELMRLQEQLAVMQQRMFGASSERSAGSEPEKTESEKTDSQEPQRGHGPKAQPTLPTVEERHELPPSEQTCGICNGAMEAMGQQTEDSEEITVVKRQFVLVVHKRQKYRCRCNASVQTAPGPLKLIPGGRYSLAFAVDVAIAKYAYHLPLERQVRMMRHEGLRIDSQTLWDQLEALSRVLRPLYDAIRAHILLSDVLHADETHWLLMQKGGSKKWYVWALATEDAVYYHLNASRGQDVARTLLDGYAGVAMTDGYAAYQALLKALGTLRLAHCMAHARRKFIEALPAYPQSQGALDLIGELYSVERTLPKLTGLHGAEREQALALRRDIRQKESAPRMQALHTWLVSQTALPKSLLHEALSYTLHLWPGLSLFVDDPRVPLDNNLVERDLRGVVVGRKNHYGSKSERGTQVAALLYTLVETAQKNGHDPRDFLLRATTHALLNPGAALLPWES